MFIARLATAVILLAACVAGIFFLPNRWWTGLLLPALLAASWEWAVLAGFSRPQRWAFLVVVLASAVLAGFAGHDAVFRPFPGGEAAIYALGSAFWLLIAVPWLAQGWRIRSAVAMGIAGWVVLVPAWLALARLQSEPEKLLALLGILWISDTAAYGAGRAWGRHKLAPGISPGKTWEGVAGAAAAVAVYYVALSFATPHWGWWNGIGGAILFAGVALAGVLGDLFESWIKRQAGVKDSGTLLPGHGGVLDRVDSMLSGLPIAALLLLYSA
jgi:phosphatidate cytidylyltransferase